MDLGLEGKAALVTGGSRGIGLASARRLAEEGADVVVCARDAERLDEAVSELSGLAGTVSGVPADATDAGDLERVVDAARERHGRVDVLVNNVGTSLRGSFAELDDATWQADLDLKLFSAIRLTRALLDTMGQGARVVNVLSTGGKTPAAGSTPTSVTRAAGLALTKALSKELAPRGVLVNAVCIGIIKSGQQDDRWRAQAPDTPREEYYRELAATRGVPLGRIGEAEEAANVVLFLASAMSSYVTGTSINVDGGSAAVL